MDHTVLMSQEFGSFGEGLCSVIDVAVPRFNMAAELKHIDQERRIQAVQDSRTLQYVGLFNVAPELMFVEQAQLTELPLSAKPSRRCAAKPEKRVIRQLSSCKRRELHG